MDPSVLLRAYKSPQWPDPVEEYKGFLSLRQMMDLGKLRQVQLKQEELENQQKARDLAEYAQFQQAAGTWDENTPIGTAARFPKYGLPFLKTIRETQEAKSRAQTQELARKKALDDQRDKLVQEYLGGLQGIAEEKDPVGQQAMHTQLATTMRERAAELGIPNIESMIWPEAPTDKAAFTRGLQSRYGLKNAQEYLGKQQEAQEKTRKAAAEELKDQTAHAGMTLGSVENQDQWTSEINSWPTLLRQQLKPSATFSTEEKRRVTQGLLSAKDRMDAEARGDTASAQRLAVEDRMRDDYLAQSKNYITLRNGYNQVVSAAKAKTGAGDLSLVFGYMKLLDPNSTVREGEQAQARQVGTIPDRIWQLYNKMFTTGETLPESVKQQFVNEARSLYGQAHADHLKIKDQFRRVAEERKLNPRAVIIDLDPATPGVQTEAPAGAAPQPSGPTRFVPLQEVMPGVQPTGTPPPRAQAPVAAPAKFEPPPKVGDVIEGDDGKYVYAGGDPKSKQSYRKISGKK